MHVTLRVCVISVLYGNRFFHCLSSTLSKEYETTRTWVKHITLLKFVLRLFVKSVSNGMDLVEDSCRNNRSVATKLNKSLLGQTIHRLQLTIRDVIEERTPVLPCVHDLIIRVRTPLLRAWLRQHTHLCAKLNNDTWWTSFFRCCKTCGSSKECCKLDDQELVDHILTAALEDQLDSLAKKLQNFNEVVIRLHET